jgi:hypothetical protein
MSNLSPLQDVMLYGLAAADAEAMQNAAAEAMRLRNNLESAHGAIVAQLTAALDALRADRPDEAIVCIRAAADIESKLADLLGLK